MPSHNTATIAQRLERYLMGVIEAGDSTKKEKAEAARQLIELRTSKPRGKQKQTAQANVLGSTPAQ
jgi:hypothetical protein